MQREINKLLTSEIATKVRKRKKKTTFYAHVLYKKT